MLIFYLTVSRAPLESISNSLTLCLSHFISLIHLLTLYFSLSLSLPLPLSLFLFHSFTSPFLISLFLSTYIWDLFSKLYPLIFMYMYTTLYMSLVWASINLVSMRSYSLTAFWLSTTGLIMLSLGQNDEVRHRFQVPKRRVWSQQVTFDA